MRRSINQQLIQASHNGDIENVKLFLDRGADIRKADDRALRYASRFANVEIIRLLKKHYIKKYGAKFICHNCIVLSCCTELCKNKLIKENYL